MAIRIGINGFGRIGRLSLRAITELYAGEVEIVAINDLTDAGTNTFLLQHDSNYGSFKGSVHAEDKSLVVNGKTIHVYAEREPDVIPWDNDGVDIVLEATGLFTDANKAKGHLGRGVKKVIIGALAKNADVTLVLGVNQDAYDPTRHHIISNASCTTNGLAPVAKVLHDNFGIEKGLLTTIHAYTNSQATVDTAAKDLRDARAAAQNVVPSSTSAAKAVGLVIPDLQGKFTGMAFRVPVPTVSVVDFTALLSREVSTAEINEVHEAAAETGPLAGILQYTEEPLVSTDLKGSPYSSIFSAIDTISLGNMVKVVAWYDNEWGYANRIADLIKYVSDKGL